MEVDLANTIPVRVVSFSIECRLLSQKSIKRFENLVFFMTFFFQGNDFNFGLDKLDTSLHVSDTYVKDMRNNNTGKIVETQKSELSVCNRQTRVQRLCQRLDHQQDFQQSSSR